LNLMLPYSSNRRGFGGSGLTEEVQEAVRGRDWESAKPILEKLVELYPDCTGADSPYPLLAMVLQAQGATNAELAVLSEYARRDAAAPEVYARLMELCRSGGNWKAVKLNAERYLAVNPLVPMPHRFLAEATENLGELTEAIGAYQALLELGPEDPAETHYRLARALYATGNPEAKRQVLQALEEAPRFRAALKLLLEIERKSTESTMNDGFRTGYGVPPLGGLVTAPPKGGTPYLPKQASSAAPEATGSP
jgi:tetratricopeptide (TPR) repeat protein